jgi:hypothetical protein
VSDKTKIGPEQNAVLKGDVEGAVRGAIRGRIDFST